MSATFIRPAQPNAVVLSAMGYPSWRAVDYRIGNLIQKHNFGLATPDETAELRWLSDCTQRYARPRVDRANP